MLGYERTLGNGPVPGKVPFVRTEISSFCPDCAWISKICPDFWPGQLLKCTLTGLNLVWLSKNFSDFAPGHFHFIFFQNPSRLHTPTIAPGPDMSPNRPSGKLKIYYCTRSGSGSSPVGHFVISEIHQVVMYRVWAWMTRTRCRVASSERLYSCYAGPTLMHNGWL